MVFRFLPFVLLCVLGFTERGFDDPWGKDGSLKYERGSKNQFPFQKTLGVKMAEKLILFHQNVISPVDGPRSNFRPTSARYMLLAMRRYGFFKGYIMGCDRLLRENKDPWVYKTIVINGTEYKWDPTFDK